MKKCIVWLRNDLRLQDNLALNAAASLGYEIIPIYILEEGNQASNIGEASQWWLHHALVDLSQQIKQAGGKLVLLKQSKQGDLLEQLENLIEQYQAEAVYWNRRYEPESIKIDTLVKEKLKLSGIEVTSFVGNILNEPQVIKNKSDKPFQVFTPFWKSTKVHPVQAPKTEKLVFFGEIQNTLNIDSLGLLPSFRWDTKFHLYWEPTRDGAEKKLTETHSEIAKDYLETRDIPSLSGTSMLAPWLHYGQLSVREIYAKLSDLGEEVHIGYLRQLYWRDFAHHLMYHFPHSLKDCLRKEYEFFPWNYDENLAVKWQKGETGYPIIDAGMRQLWETGWMHNRVRMIVASFLVKHLLQDWRTGQAWFDHTLLDADLANNAMGWQWSAGCGADAAPYFRVFNPVLQGEKFDPDGDYVKKYLPELSKLPKKYIHKPWELNEIELKMYGVELGVDYPEPIVELRAGRDQALAAFKKFKSQTY